LLDRPRQEFARWMDIRSRVCPGGQNGGGALARVFPQHLRAASGDPSDGHAHLAAPDGIYPRVPLDPAGDLHEVHQGGEVGAVVADPALLGRRGSVHPPTCTTFESPSFCHFAQPSRRIRVEPFEARQVLCKQLDGYGAE